MASVAAEAFCEKYASTDDSHIKQNPEFYLEHTIPYLTVRTLHTTRDTLARHEKALKSLEADSRWIKWFAIITGVLTAALFFLTIVLAIYAGRLDAVMNSPRLVNESPAPTPTPSATLPGGTSTP